MGEGAVERLKKKLLCLEVGEWFFVSVYSFCAKSGEYEFKLDELFWCNPCSFEEDLVSLA